MGNTTSKESGGKHQSDMKLKTKHFPKKEDASKQQNQLGQAFSFSSEVPATRRTVSARAPPTRSSGAPMSISGGQTNKSKSEQKKATTAAAKKPSPVATRRRARSTDQASKQTSSSEELVMLGGKNQAVSQSARTSSTAAGAAPQSPSKRSQGKKQQVQAQEKSEEKEEESSSTDSDSGIDSGVDEQVVQTKAEVTTPQRNASTPTRKSPQKQQQVTPRRSGGSNGKRAQGSTTETPPRSTPQTKRRRTTPSSAGSNRSNSATEQDPSTLFAGLTFYIPPGPTRADWRSKIEDHGGMVVRYPAEATNRAEVIYLFDPSQTTLDQLGTLMRETRPTFSTDWVSNSIANNSHVDLYSYSARALCKELPKRAGKKHRTTYSGKEDALLVELVKELEDTNDYTLGGNRLWKRIEHEFRQRGYDRTYQSLKDHFRRHIVCVTSLSAPGVTDNLEVPEHGNSSDEESEVRKKGGATRQKVNRQIIGSSTNDTQEQEEPLEKASPVKVEQSREEESEKPEPAQQQMSSASALSSRDRMDIKAEIDAISYSYGMSTPEVIAQLMECNGDIRMLKQRLRESS